MFAMTIVMEDSTISARRDCDEGSANNGKWVCTFGDNLSGKTHGAILTDVQIAAVLALMAAGEEGLSESVVAELYAIAEVAVDGFPREVRPIP